MTEALASVNSGIDPGTRVTTKRELRVQIVSPTLPPMNLVDLPGTVQSPQDLREATESLVKQYLTDTSGVSLFLAVVKADQGEGNSTAMRLVTEHGAASRTIGVFTHCDKMNDDAYGMLRGWLTNPDAADHIKLEPHGYVATMNKDPRPVIPGETNRSRLMRQARKEEPWFRDEGFEDLLDGPSSVVGTRALVAKLSLAYLKNVHQVFVPMTAWRLEQELRTSTEQRRILGEPAAPGDLAAGGELDALRQAAVDTAHRLLSPCYERQLQEFVTGTLRTLHASLKTTMEAKSSVALNGVQPKLAAMRAEVLSVFTAAARPLCGLSMMVKLPRPGEQNSRRHSRTMPLHLPCSACRAWSSGSPHSASRTRHTCRPTSYQRPCRSSSMRHLHRIHDSWFSTTTWRASQRL